jgi:hypothetical protein
MSALKRQICNLARSDDRHAFDVNVFPVELAGDIPIGLVNQLEEGFRRSGDWQIGRVRGRLSVDPAEQKERHSERKTRRHS